MSPPSAMLKIRDDDALFVDGRAENDDDVDDETGRAGLAAHHSAAFQAAVQTSSTWTVLIRRSLP